MKMINFIKNIIIGFWKNGFVALFKIVLEHWLLSFLIIFFIAYLCSDSNTELYAWFLIGVFALYSAIKALIEIFIEIKNYMNFNDIESKTLILQKIGGKIFDFVLCVVGVFQTLKVFSHISRITKSSSSAISVVDDVASAISKFLKNLRK